MVHPWGVQTAGTDVIAQTLLVASGIGYGWAVTRLHRRARAWPALRSGCFAAALIAIWVATGSSLSSYDETNVTVHLGQHLILMMLAPPLLVLARPGVLAMQATGRRVQTRLATGLNSRVGRTLTHPLVGWVLYLGSMAAMLADRSVYRFVVGHPVWHGAGHLLLLLLGLLYWEPLLGGVTGRRTGRPTRVVSVLANMPFEVLIGLWFRYQDAPIVGAGTIADTQRAGEVWIIGATALSTIWLLVIISQWAAAAWREEKRAEAGPVSSEWSVPWWVSGPDRLTADAGGP